MPSLPINVDAIEAVLLRVLDGAADKRSPLGSVTRYRWEYLLGAGAGEHLQGVTQTSSNAGLIVLLLLLDEYKQPGR